MQEIQNLKVSFTIRTLVIFIGSVIGIVASFTIGYMSLIATQKENHATVMQAIINMGQKQELRDLKQDNMIQINIDEDRRLNARIDNLRR